MCLVTWTFSILKVFEEIQCVIYYNSFMRQLVSLAKNKFKERNTKGAIHIALLVYITLLGSSHFTRAKFMYLFCRVKCWSVNTLMCRSCSMCNFCTWVGLFSSTGSCAMFHLVAHRTLRPNSYSFQPSEVTIHKEWIFGPVVYQCTGF